MNEFRLKDMQIGHEESFSTEVTKEMFDHFLAITGDINPMHVDEEYAKKNGMGGG